MAKVVITDAVITDAVVDVERWLQGKAERAAEFGTFATNVTDHIAADGSNNVVITADIHDMAGAQAAMEPQRTKRLFRYQFVMHPVRAGGATGRWVGDLQKNSGVI